MKVSAFAIIVLAAAVSGCSLMTHASSGGGTGGAAGDNGQAAPHCYSTVTSPQGSAVTVAALGDVNCASVAQFLGDQFPGYTVAQTATMGPGNAVCQGQLGGVYPATVIDPTGDPGDVECTYLGFSPAP